MNTASVSHLHIGRKVEKLRKLKGVKQETLAISVGLTQPEISTIENSETIDEALLIRIAEALNLTPEIIKDFDESHAFYSIDNKVDNVTIHDTGHAIHQVFSPIDKVVELYERLLASEREKIDILKNIQQK
ncbi:MAG: helix-turn-helix transcriptional regulator [Chitinophagaceae bacterium]|nr:helix-turn-helix transcriptional regulator [Chitinophagaceae bacterium]